MICIHSLHKIEIGTWKWAILYSYFLLFVDVSVSVYQSVAHIVHFTCDLNINNFTTFQTVNTGKCMYSLNALNISKVGDVRTLGNLVV